MKGLDIQKNKIAVIGCGISGISVARFFLNKNIAVDIFEDKKEADFNTNSIQDFLKNEKFSIYFSDTNYDVNIDLYDYVIASPGVHLDHKIILLAEKHSIEYITDINAFSRMFREAYPKGKIISITGSNGKSTTVSLLYEVLSKIKNDVHLGGNIGTSPLDFLNNITTEEPIIILETSSYQLEYLKSQDYFDIACILNLSDNHLDRYHGKKELYAKAKLGGIDKEKTRVLINYDDEYTKKYIAPHFKGYDVMGVQFENSTTPHTITLEDAVIFYTNLDVKKVYIRDVKKMKIRGMHNIYNTAFVCGIFELLGDIAISKVEDLCYVFGGLEHRIQSVTHIDGVEYINDSKSTSPDATIKALEAVGGQKNIVLISGGMDKDIEYTSMEESWREYVKAVVFLPGNANEKLKELAKKTNVFILGEVLTMKDAVDFARKNIQSGDIVLLSPSTASFASFKSFEDRGNQFIDCVQKI